MKKESIHPCFDKKASGNYGRVHLPVAPKCNVSCNFCNRKYDCVNESRPGVTSAVLTPYQAKHYMRLVMEKAPYISVAGIAGPGDPMANASNVLKTMKLIKQDFPEILFCLSSNGLGMPGRIEALSEFVTHATITINSADPETGGKIYSRVTDGKTIYSGSEGGEVILSRQLRSINELKKHGITVKVNFIAIPGINFDQAEDVAKITSYLGADLMNIIPLKPTEGTVFGNLEEPSAKKIKELRATAEKYIPQMTHCRRCRADAVGLLGDDKSTELMPGLAKCSAMTCKEDEKKEYAAIATREGILVNEHLGKADSFHIWEKTDSGVRFVEERKAPLPGGGETRWDNLASVLSDCTAVLASQAGPAPEEGLKKHGIKVLLSSGLIEDAVDAYFNGDGTDFLKPRKAGVGGGCSGMGEGAGCC
jgi:nitrogen fixation protein NifB